MSDSGLYDSTGGVAIIGMSGRFPGAKNIAQFWQNLRDGVESITLFSDQELEEAGVDPAILSDPNYVKAGGILDDVELFDAAFFGFNPREAEILDPQQRLFLECAWEAFENAGYDPQACPGAVGVYAGVSISSYLDNIYSNPEIVELIGDYQILLGNDKDQLPTYVSYKFDLKGPSMAIQTACSTSLVAVCMACQSLLDYQCDMALAGGSSIAIPQKAGYLYQEGMIVSPDGHCRAFDSQAQGTVGGNGVGVVLLKRLDDAVANGDYIYAVVKGSALNNDGALKVGYTAPSIEGQAEVITMAHALAGVDPETISYVEAHGTGTPLGDPIEIKALTEAFRARTDKKNFCAVGSVKTNIGHLDSAAGVAGLIKTALALKHRMIPPSLHFKQPNPKIDFANSPFYVNDRLREWRTGATPRLAGVSSFGIGGTNAHVVVEEAPVVRPSPEMSRPYELLLVSARTPSALEKATSNLAEHLRANPDLNRADVAYTLQVGRKPFNHRRMLVCRDLVDAASALERLDPKRVLTSSTEPKERPVVFMFSGQGTQYVNMGRELYDAEPFFREQVDICSQLLKPHLGLDLRSDVLYPNAGESEQESAQRLEQTALTQPALFVVEYALARLWMKWGVRPRAMIGHSIGEYVAACLSGVFSLEDALQLVATRGRLMQQAAKGAMLAVPLSEKEIEPLLGEKLSLAAINGPSLCVVSGPTESIGELEVHLDEKGLAGRRLHTSHAFHSAMMEPLLAPFTEQVIRVKFSPPELPYISNVTGSWITTAEATDPVYWAKHLRQTVRFADGLERLLKESDPLLLEVGPGQTLSTLARQHPSKASEQVVLNSLRHPQERQPDVAFLLTTLGRLWLAGVRVDWPNFYEGARRRLPLPTYPFERQRYWIEAQERVESADTRAFLPLRKRPDIADWFYIPSWKRSALPELFQQSDLSARESRWLLFSDECGVGAGLAQRLESAGQDVFTVMPGEQFVKRSENTYVINPREPQDYDALLRELNALDWIPEVIVHLWNVTPDDEAQRGIESFEKFQALGFYSLLFLAQALGERLNAEQLQIAVVSNQMQAVTGEETLCPSKATALGLCKVIPEEYTQITCRSIDIALPGSGLRPESRLIDQLVAELAVDTSDPVVAYRGKHRWVQTFEAVPLDERAEKSIRLRERGVYLITGGLGGIGLTLAEHLAATAQARLALLGRSAFPERDEWARWLATHDDDDDVGRKIRKFQTLEGLGAEIMIVSADVADPEALRDVVNRVTERFGRITGVIHSAGVAGGRIIQLQTMEETRRVMSPKVQGTLALDVVFEDAELDFLVLCSSLNAIQGAAGQADYCGANAFLDAFAHHASSRNGRHVVSVNWDAWQEVGMAVNTIVPRDMEEERAESLKQGILPAEGVEALTRILSTTLPQVAVSTIDLPALLELEEGETPSSDGEEIEEQPTSLETLHERPSLSSDYVTPQSEVERILASTWQKLLGVEQVGIHDNFFELGGHSLLAVQLISRLRESFQVELTVRDLFDAPTVAEIAERIESSRRSVEEDTDEVDQVLRLVEQLSEDQLRELLARQGDTI